MVRVVVGRVGRAHGIRGEVAVDVRTDDPAGRFATGAVLATDPESVGPLRVRSTRWHGERLLVEFAGTSDRAAADRLRGVVLLADSADSPPLEQPDEFYDRDLVGLHVTTRAGSAVGVVDDVLHLPGQDLLAVRSPDGREVLVPFVSEIVPVVDVSAGSVVIDPPPGLLDPDTAE